jgi:hypothetical protein
VSKHLAPLRQTSALSVDETQATLAELLAQHAILFDKIVDDGLLLAIDPAGKQQE